jgi:phenylalanyl-tRNA synthetase beta chain
MMRVPIKWLRLYLDLDKADLTVKDLAEKLTMAGNEVERIKEIGGEWDNISVAELVAIAPHPDADRLQLATVDTGNSRETVVCGAPNLNVGDKIAYAAIGARLIDPYKGGTVKLKPARIRGVASAGMICSEKELGIADNHEGILVLDPKAPTGKPLKEHLGDYVLELAVTPNRPDCLSVIGIAREVAALTGLAMRIMPPEYEEKGAPIDEQVKVEIRDAELCPRYCASLIRGVEVGPSPNWLQDKLLACGQRPINNIVDITNYVMLSYGQPLHSFDFNRVRGGRIIVRRANAGEQIVSLDGNLHDLTENMLVIADAERSVAVAGIMGGANSDITDRTTDILLEAASFNPASIHYTSADLKLPSEASMRFERGISAELAAIALRRATQLILQLGGGEAATGIIDEYPGRKEPLTLTVTPAETARILGMEFSTERITELLTPLGFECHTDGDAVSVTTPYWRTDVHYTVDIIEEIARMEGYDKLPTTLLSGSIPHFTPDRLSGFKRDLMQRLAGLGFQEIISYTLTSMSRLGKLRPDGSGGLPALRLKNPMTEEHEYLRPTLRANLLATLADNRRHEENGIRLFEAGKTFEPEDNDLPREYQMLCAVISGPKTPPGWQGAPAVADFYDAKGIAENLLAGIGVKAEFNASTDASLHPAVQAKITVGETAVGIVGEIHPAVRQSYEIAEPVFIIEFDMSALSEASADGIEFRQIPRFPAVVRDIALLVDTTVSHQQIEGIITSFPLVAQTSVFDVYSGKQVTAGKKSTAYHVVFQSANKTLTDNAVSAVLKKILGRLQQELGAELRG